ncbi:MAG: hypothetical protein EBR49_12950 [Betaproteobacteria bacterium]|nr:hypothetical protein [Betaproteobacteria bacterium]
MHREAAMGFWTIDNSKWAYRLDFALYGVAVVALTLLLLFRTPPGLQWLVLAYTVAGMFVWSGVEYALHRFLTLGVVGGYVLYAATHHALHHWRLSGSWMQQRKLWHARHHHHSRHAVCFGVTNAVWDRVFGTAYPKEK